MKIKRTIYLSSALMMGAFILSLSSCNLLASAGYASKGLPYSKVPQKLASTTANSEVNLDHSTWTQLLQKHVNSEGMVDYKGFKKDQNRLNDYLNMLANNEPTKKWSVQEQLAYYINAYNAYTVKLILDHYPVKSIKDINGAWTKANANLGGTKISLGAIENSILRKMNEPRIHFAINCASISCPKLRTQAYTAAKINEQLEEAAREFINSDKNEISAEAAKLSAIFSFYPKDFKKAEGSIIQYVNQFSNTKIKAGAKISYKEYDWNLNEQN